MAEPYAKNQATSAEEAAKIVPRAEFRVFGKDVIEGVKEHMWKCKAQLFKARVMPAETYVLSKKTDEANVKVRDGLLDIKTEVGTTPEGYEIFQPRGKFAFPVKRAELEVILGHLGVKLELGKDTYAFDEFCDLVRSAPELALVSVEKVRYGFSVNGVICEYAKVWFNGALVESACCESEDYGAMSAAVEALGLAGQPNTNYLREGKRVIGWAKP
ncbi:MAG: hypothetical protein MR009_10210 [Sutterellaceae bacterium]|nr:hypothetical protein [Sutterellaceae bacterium]MDD7441663.1 hypothetical protein [Sutterellaceae bacterium]MDY2868261.1 hypothetical protein [Mesosutterella sp.]